MDRRDFLKSTGAAAAAATLTPAAVEATVPAIEPPVVAAPAAIGEARRWVLALPPSLDHMEVRTAAHRLQYQLAALFPKTEIVIETAIGGGLEAVLTGFADLGIGLDTQHDAFHPAMPVFAGLPRTMDAAAAVHAAWLRGSGGDLRAAVYADVDAVAVSLFATGPSPGFYTDVAFESARDLVGQRVGVRGLAGDALRLLGADVHAAEADGAGAIAARNLVAAEALVTPFEAQAQWSYDPLTPHGLTMTLATRGSFWRRLSMSERAIIEGVAAATHADSVQLAGARAETLVQVARFRQWPIHTATPDALARDLDAANAAAIDAIAARDPLARRAIESLRRAAASA